MTHLIFVEKGIMIFILIGIVILLTTTVIESLHLNDKGWEKPKSVCTLESTGTGFIITAFATGIIYCFVFALINI